MTPEKNLQKLAKLLAIMDTQVSNEAFVEAFKVVLAQVAKVETALIQKLDTRLGKITDGKDGVDGKDGKSIRGEKGERGEDGAIGRAIFGGKGEPGNAGKDGSPDTPTETRDKLESIKEEDEKLKIEAIGNLRKELDEAKKSGKTVSIGGTPRGIQLYVDSVKKGMVANFNLVAGTGMAIAYSKVNGQDTMTFNASGGGITVSTPAETPNAVITLFTTIAEPKWVVADGITYYEGAGYSYVALAVTMDIPPSSSIRIIT